VSGEPSNLTNDIIQGILDRRDKLALMDAEHKKATAGIKAEMAKGEAWLLGQLNQTGAKGGSFDAGTLITKTKRFVNIKDREKFIAFIKRTGQIELITLRAASKSVDEYMEKNEGNLPDGIEVTSERVLEIRRSK